MRSMKIMKFNENHRIPRENYKNREDLGIPIENHQNHEKIITFNMRITKIMNIIEFH